MAVGFGSNFLSIIGASDQLILHNGSHRAYALRDLGITHATCVIQHIYSREELNVVASSAVAERPDVFVRQPRQTDPYRCWHPGRRHGTDAALQLEA